MNTDFNNDSYHLYDMLPVYETTHIKNDCDVDCDVDCDIKCDVDCEKKQDDYAPINNNNFVLPETRNKINIGDGKFEYITDIFTREMLINAWQAVSQTELWDFVREPIYSFMMSDDPRISVITKKMEELGYNRHSGSSFGITMRYIQFLAQYGEDEFKKKY